MKLTKTFSGDFTTWIAGKIWAEVKKWDDERLDAKADPEVVKAAEEMLNDDDDSLVVRDEGLRTDVHKIFRGIDSRLLQAENRIEKLSAQVRTLGSGIADTQKLLVNQNQMLEDKFDLLLEGFGTKAEREKERQESLKADALEAGLEDGLFRGGSRALTKGGRGKKKFSIFDALLEALLRRGGARVLRFLARRFIPRGIRSRGRLLRRVASPGALKRRVGKELIKRLPGKLSKRLGREVLEEGATQITKRAITKTASKSVAKKIPLAGALVGTGFALERLMKGDVEGAMLEFASGMLGGSGLGILGSIGIDAYLFDRDMKNEGVYEKGNVNVSDGMFGGTIDDIGSSILTSSVALASAAGVSSEVNAEIKKLGLDYSIENVPFIKSIKPLSPSSVKVASNIQVVGEKYATPQIIETIMEKLAQRSGDAGGDGGFYTDTTGEPGFNDTSVNHNVAVFDGEVTKIGYDYNYKTKRGYGNYVVIRSTSPLDGSAFDALYAHFPKGKIKVLKGQKIEAGADLGPLGTLDDDPAQVGSIEQPHMSVDFFEPGGKTPFNHWMHLVELSQDYLVTKPTVVAETPYIPKTLNLKEGGAADLRVGEDKAFLKGLHKLAEKWELDPAHLLALMASESSLFADNMNDGGYAGLIQIGPDTAKEMGTTVEALTKMSRAEQLVYVDKYFQKWGLPKRATKGELYQAVLAPSTLHYYDEGVGLGADEYIYKSGSAAYEENKPLDLNDDGFITRRELGARIDRKMDEYGINESDVKPPPRNQQLSLLDEGSKILEDLDNSGEQQIPIVVLNNSIVANNPINFNKISGGIDWEQTLEASKLATLA